MKTREAGPWLMGVAGIAIWGCGDTPDHGGADAAHDPHRGGGVFTRLSGDIELFVEYPHQIMGVESEEPWQIYLTRVEGWRPVTDAGFALIVYGPPAGRQEIEAVPETPGLYMVSPTIP